MESQIAQSDRTRDAVKAANRGDPIPIIGPVFAVFACGASVGAWLWFTSLQPNYFLHFAVSLPVLFFGVVGHLVLEEFRKTSAVYNFRRHVPLRRNRYYAFALVFTGLAWISIYFQLPIHARFVLSRPAMNALVAEVRENPDAVRPATMRVGWYVVQTAPLVRRDGAMVFHLAGDNETGFTYATTPIEYPGWNAGNGGRLGGGWYWFSDD